MSEIQKEILVAPKLPSTVQGDGRYLMTLLKEFTANLALQVNAANEFTAEEVAEASAENATAPRRLVVTFTSLGMTVAWEAPLSGVPFMYELRTDTAKGNDVGCLYQGTTREFIVASSLGTLTRDCDLYCYAIYLDESGYVYSNPINLHYTKQIPDAPTEVTMTRAEGGTLITFSSIPTVPACMGAEIIINENVVKRVTDNMYFFEHDIDYAINNIKVCYYDLFGEGYYSAVGCVVPDVTNFIAERNGSELDLYWDALDIYGVYYVVRISAMGHNWNEGVELFQTKLNKKKVIYPITGTYYVMIKAVDSFGNTSTNAVWYCLTNDLQIDKNVIIEQDEATPNYTGNKLFTQASAQTLSLIREAMYGEYLFSVTLPKKYRARNWIDEDVVSFTNDSLYWDDCNFLWDSEEATSTMWGGRVRELGSSKVRHWMSRKKDTADTYKFYAGLNNSLLTKDSASPTTSPSSPTYYDCRWAKGLYINGSNKVAYNTTLTSNIFTYTFNVVKRDKLENACICTLKGSTGWITLFYDGDLDFSTPKETAKFIAKCSDGNNLEIEVPATEYEAYSIGISQSATKRSLYVLRISTGEVFEHTIDATPVDTMTSVQYDKDTQYMGV